MKKRYYAFVAKDMVDYFEGRVRDKEIKIIKREPATSTNGEPLLYYELEAEEGVIDSKWELE
jgi:hypothetical protein